jgi:hydrogenase maturation protein HypF
MNRTEPLFEHEGELIRIRGQVQGVGFRPAVYRIAQQLKLCGEVINDGAGVRVILQSSTLQVDEFIARIQIECPALARIESIQREPVDSALNYEAFSIQSSQAGSIKTGVVPDAASCNACIQDIQNSHNHRHQYAFTNCTHCGPRLSIIEKIPYDRAHTSMKHFALCEKCQQEYDDPVNRRFHAQPNACPDCGPFLELTDALGEAIPGNDVLTMAAELIQQGKIVAIKGIGGFQLACDARNNDAVTLLRERKRRPSKALALMASSVEQVSQYCEVNDAERLLLESTAAPIVILQNKPEAPSLAPGLAPDQHSLGFMLAYSPLHHILMQKLNFPIVLTSGNASEEPQCIDNKQAIQQLSHIADFFMVHNRDIVNRIDDSVVRSIGDKTHYYRRARGYAPAPLKMPAGFDNAPAILALGGEMKNTFCLLKEQQATLSQHMGNLENLHTYNDYLKNLDLYQQLFDFKAQAIVIDSHPEYLSSKLGRQWAHDAQIPLIETQHHHAHIASCMADNLWSMDQGPVIGVALDGLGFGDDGTLWGAEFLQVDYVGYKRLASLKPVPLPGGNRAMVEPWRNAYAQLSAERTWKDIAELYPDLAVVQLLNQQPLTILEQMITKRMNSPLSSSAGRLFDAFAATLGICTRSISYEGQAAIELEALVTPEALQQAHAYAFDIQVSDMRRINMAAMWPALLEDLERGIDHSLICARFHVTLARAIERMVSILCEETGINTVALSGGVFQNATLLTLTQDLLAQQGFNLLTHNHVPANDGGLALGQAAIAAARLHTGDI